ncbi:MAG: hypothetical protein Q9222_003064 [Ikaeria aurantiellina]
MPATLDRTSTPNPQSWATNPDYRNIYRKTAKPTSSTGRTQTLACAYELLLEPDAGTAGPVDAELLVLVVLAAALEEDMPPLEIDIAKLVPEFPSDVIVLGVLATVKDGGTVLICEGDAGVEPPPIALTSPVSVDAAERMELNTESATSVCTTPSGPVMAEAGSVGIVVIGSRRTSRALIVLSRARSPIELVSGEQYEVDMAEMADRI